jgi:outer membrane protein assembly factor BamB
MQAAYLGCVCVVVGLALWQARSIEADSPASGVVRSGDWPMWGGSTSRNMFNAATGIDIEFEPNVDAAKGTNVLWTMALGSQTYGNPIVSGGKVFVGTNNGAEYLPKHQGDRGCVLAFDEKTGKFLWQLTREKLEQGRDVDWPEQGICSTACVEGDRMWVVTNRAELVCLDTEGFLDGENDGPYTAEVDAEQQDADIVWIVDMMGTLKVYPHNMATSSPLVHEDLVYVLTSNGVDESHVNIPSPEAPSFLAVNKSTGEIAWQDNSMSDEILHGQWGSPGLGIVNGQAQVYFPGGDGWLYALDARTGGQIWKFDLNPKDSVWELQGRGTKNSIIATPVFLENTVLLAVGDDPEHGEGVGHLYRIDATKQGDVTQGGAIWHYGGTDEKGKYIFRRTLSTVAVHDGLVYAADLSGRFHCVDFETGPQYWVADVFSQVWGSPLVADGKVFLGNEDGILSIFETGKELKPLREVAFNSSLYSTPTIANGVMFVSDRARLYAIKIQP